MVQILALQVYFRAAEIFAHFFREIQHRRPARVIVQQGGKFAPESGVVHIKQIFFLQFAQRPH
jgi:hypothetical protein